MVLGIKTNISALTSFENINRTENRSISSVERLASGLRINKSADDSSGMVIADSLRAQALGFGQASRNANDAISIVQIADAALAESQNILNAIKVKSIQAAQDGQTLDSRKSIQSDINMLKKEFDSIAETTSFNGQKLLSGGFTDKSFQIGSGSGEVINLSLGSAVSNKIGHLTTGNLVIDRQAQGKVHIGISEAGSDKLIEIEPVELAYDNKREHGLGLLADSINRISDRTGVTASLSVLSKTDSSIKKGITSSDFSINRIKIGSIQVQDNDADGSLVKAINNKSLVTGVVASVNNQGRLILNSEDGRAIKVDFGAETGSENGTAEIFSGQDLSTFGTINLQSRGSSMICAYDLGGGLPVSVADPGLNIKNTAHMDRDSI